MIEGLQDFFLPNPRRPHHRIDYLQRRTEDVIITVPDLMGDLKYIRPILIWNTHIATIIQFQPLNLESLASMIGERQRTLPGYPSSALVDGCNQR